MFNESATAAIAKVARIIANRDGMDYNDALAMVDETLSTIEDMDYPLDAGDIFMDELGLEPDYLMEIVFSM